MNCEWCKLYFYRILLLVLVLLVYSETLFWVRSFVNTMVILGIRAERGLVFFIWVKFFLNMCFRVRLVIEFLFMYFMWVIVFFMFLAESKFFRVNFVRICVEYWSSFIFAVLGEIVKEFMILVINCFIILKFFFLRFLDSSIIKIRLIGFLVYFIGIKECWDS